MKLVKCVISHNSYKYQVYCKMGEIVDEKNNVLIGFKDSLPVVTNSDSDEKKNTEGGGKKILRVQVDPNTGEKFINLNGKRLKMIPESQVKSQLKSSQIKTVCIKPVRRFKVVTKIPLDPKSLNKFENVKPDSQVLSNKMKHSVNLDLLHNSVLKKTNVISLKNPSSDKGSEHAVDTNIMKQITADNYLNLQESSTNADTSNRLKCNQPQSHKKITDMKINVDEKEVQTESNNLSRSHPELLKHVGIQTEAFQVEYDDLIKSLTQDSLVSYEPPISNTLYSLLEDSLIPSNGRNYVGTFFHELQNALKPNSDGNMPIHVAVLKNNLIMVKRSCFILEIINQSIDVRSKNNLTALQLAVIHEADRLIIEYLITKNASLDVFDDEGNNVIHLAAKYNRATALETLLHLGKRTDILDICNYNGFTPLIICALNGFHDCAELLLCFDAEVNTRDQLSGRTALFHAAEKKDFEMVQLLLRNDADTKVKNFFGTSSHDAMYEVDDISDEIKQAILSKTVKRRNTEDLRGMAKLKKYEENKGSLKTYARLEKIKDNVIKTFTQQS